MNSFLLCAGRSNLINDVLSGDPMALTFLVGGIIVAAGLGWLYIGMLRRKGQKLADALGGCKYTFSPDGFFGKKVFVIEGQQHGIPFTINSQRIAKGDWRTYVEFPKPRKIGWQDLKAELSGDAALGIEGAMGVSVAPDTVTVEFFGVGGDPAWIRLFFEQIHQGIQRRMAS